MAPQGLGVAELLARLESLESRVRQLEVRLAAASGDRASVAGEADTGGIPALAGPQLAPELHLSEAGNLVPLFARALFALAGGYLLRWLTTSSLAPPLLGVTLALAYAALWMVLATRHAERDRLTGAVYMAISVLALSPMLWETTVILKLLAPWAAALVLAVFTAACLLLSWKHHLEATAWLGAVAGAAVSLALCAGTHDLVPYCAALLAIAAILETSSARGFWLGPRRVVALVADLAIAWLVFVYGRTELPEGYAAFPPILGWALPAALLLIYVGGTAFRTLILHIDVMPFEVAQVLAGFGFLVWAATRREGSMVVPGAVLLFCGLGCYAVAFGRLIHEAHTRNLQVYSILGLALIALGSGMAMPAQWTAATCAAASIVLGLVHQRTGGGGLTATVHSLAFIGVAGFVSGLAAESFSILLRDGTALSPALGAVAVLAAMAAATTLLPAVAPRLIAIMMLAWVLTAVLAAVVLPMAPDIGWRAALRTLLLVGASLITAAIAKHRDFPQLFWIPLGGMVFALGRFVVQDLPEGHPLPIFLGLLAYGAAMLILSRLMRGWRPLKT